MSCKEKKESKTLELITIENNLFLNITVCKFNLNSIINEIFTIKQREIPGAPFFKWLCGLPLREQTQSKLSPQ